MDDYVGNQSLRDHKNTMQGVRVYVSVLVRTCAAVMKADLPHLRSPNSIVWIVLLGTALTDPSAQT